MKKSVFLGFMCSCVLVIFWTVETRPLSDGSRWTFEALTNESSTEPPSVFMFPSDDDDDYVRPDLLFEPTTTPSPTTVTPTVSISTDDYDDDDNNSTTPAGLLDRGNLPGNCLTSGCSDPTQFVCDAETQSCRPILSDV